MVIETRPGRRQVHEVSRVRMVQGRSCAATGSSAASLLFVARSGRPLFAMGRAWAMAACVIACLAAAPTTSLARVSATTTQDPVAAAAHNRQQVDDAFARWAAGGSDFFAEVLSPDVVWTIEGSGPTAGTYRGLADFNARAVRPFVSRLRTPVRPVSRRLWADGDHVIINWVGEAVAMDGRPYRNHYAWILRMERGKAVEVTAFLDLAPYEDVIRRIPAPGGEGVP